MIKNLNLLSESVLISISIEIKIKEKSKMNFNILFSLLIMVVLCDVTTSSKPRNKISIEFFEPKQEIIFIILNI